MDRCFYFDVFLSATDRSSSMRPTSHNLRERGHIFDLLHFNTALHKNSYLVRVLYQYISHLISLVQLRSTFVHSFFAFVFLCFYCRGTGCFHLRRVTLADPMARNCTRTSPTLTPCSSEMTKSCST